MKKMYCSSCGSQNIYSGTKPNFCQKCGEPFGAVKKQVAKTEEEDSAPVKLPDLGGEGLEFDIETFDKGADTLGQIMGTQDGVGYDFGEEPKTKKISKKDFLESFQKEAGSIRGGKGKNT
jgi:hypothetical protein